MTYFQSWKMWHILNDWDSRKGSSLSLVTSKFVRHYQPYFVQRKPDLIQLAPVSFALNHKTYGILNVPLCCTVKFDEQNLEVQKFFISFTWDDNSYCNLTFFRDALIGLRVELHKPVTCSPHVADKTLWVNNLFDMCCFCGMELCQTVHYIRLLQPLYFA